MAVVEIVMMTAWSCECGNMFGRSGHPVTPMTERTFKDQVCTECASHVYPYPIIHSSLARPPCG